jgi:hypothetical protein
MGKDRKFREEEGGKRGLKGYAKQLIKELVKPEKSFSVKFYNNGTFVKIKQSWL